VNHSTLLSLERKHLRYSILVPMGIVGIMVFLHLLPIESCLGIEPRCIEKLHGIILSPFFHADWSHLLSNLPPLFLLMAGLFYYYPGRFFQILLLGTLLNNITLWFFARSGCHIGASGIIYFLSAFFLLSAFLARNRRMGAFVLIIVFLYGSLIWGIFPNKPEISWEAHLGGAMWGFIFSFLFRHQPTWLSRIEPNIPESDPSLQQDQDFETETELKNSTEIENWLNFKEIKYFYKEDNPSDSNQ